MSTSSHLNKLIIRNNAFLLKKRDIMKPFSTESTHFRNVSSYCYSGIVNKKTLAVVPAADKKGFTVAMKKTCLCAQCPAKNTVEETMKAGTRRPLKNFRNVLIGNKYRQELSQAALRRAYAVFHSEKVPQVKKAEI